MMHIDGNLPCLVFGNGKAVMKGCLAGEHPMMIICQLADEAVVKTSERVSEQQVRDSKDVLGMVFTNKESVDVVIGWLTLLKENYERLIQEG